MRCSRELAESTEVRGRGGGDEAAERPSWVAAFGYEKGAEGHALLVEMEREVRRRGAPPPFS